MRVFILFLLGIIVCSTLVFAVDKGGISYSPAKISSSNVSFDDVLGLNFLSRAKALLTSIIILGHISCIFSFFVLFYVIKRAGVFYEEG